MLAGIAPAAERDASRPNVLFITVDTLRADHLSCYGYAWKTSPRIDLMAREGVVFERAYTTIPLTGPAHFSMFTSRYPQEHGARRNGVAMPSDRELVILPQLLRAHGYRTAGFISSWVLTGRLTHIDEWFDHYDEDLTRSYQLFNSSRWAEDVTPKVVDWLERNGKGDQPFFLFVHYFDPHSPYNFRTDFEVKTRNPKAGPQTPVTDEKIRERYRDYDSEIAYTDHHLGQLFDALDKQGLRESTLVVLTSDHGESLGEHDYVGHGRHLYENIVRVPLVMRLPGKMAAGKRVKTPVSILDLAPTVVDLTVKDKVEANKARLTFHGRSLAPAAAGKGSLSERMIYFLTFPGKKGFAPGWLSWLWISDEELPLRFGYAEGHAKWIWSPGENHLERYDISRDPFELKPQVHAKNSNPYRTQTERLRKWFARTEKRGEEQQLSKQDMDVLKSLGYVQ